MTIVIGRNPRKSALTLRLEARQEEVSCTHRCDCGYHVTGPTGQAREKLRAHRVAKHPERPAIAKRPKKPKAPRYELNAEDKKILADLAERKKTAKRASRPKKANGRPRGGRYAQRVGAAELQRLYVDQRLTITQIAAIHHVSHSTVADALAEHGIPRRELGRMAKSWITVDREAAAWKLYQSGLTAWQIALIAQQIWGYSTPLQTKRSLLYAFRANGRQTRPAIRNLQVPTVNADEALAILQSAESTTRGDTNK